MAGSKKNKLKKSQSPLKTTETPPQVLANDDDDLMNVLFAQLDSRNPTVQAESATIIKEIQCDAQANRMEGNNKQDAKARFKARQVSTATSTIALRYIATGKEGSCTGSDTASR
jgi:OTU domain-containing protein 6